MDDMKFDFYGKYLRGQQEQRAQNKRAFEVINGTLGEAFGKLYVEKYFPAEAKAQMVELIDYLKKNQGADYTCISDNSEKQNINSLKVQARDANFPGDVDKASKDDLIQFLESLK